MPGVGRGASGHSLVLGLPRTFMARYCPDSCISPMLSHSVAHQRAITHHPSFITDRSRNTSHTLYCNPGRLVPHAWFHDSLAKYSVPTFPTDLTLALVVYLVN